MKILQVPGDDLVGVTWNEYTDKPLTNDQVGFLVSQMEVVRRNFQELGKRQIDSRNIANVSIQIRHLENAESYAFIASPPLIDGGVLFAFNEKIVQDAPNFFWDDTNNRLGLGTNAPTSRLHVVAPAATPGILIDAGTTEHTDTAGAIDINLTTSVGAVTGANVATTTVGLVSNVVGIQSTALNSGSSDGVNCSLFRGTLTYTATNLDNWAFYDVGTGGGGGFGTSNGIMLFRYSSSYSSATTFLSPEYGIYMKQSFAAGSTVTDSFRPIYIERGGSAVSGDFTDTQPFIELYLPLSSGGGVSATSTAQFIKAQMSCDVNNTRVSGKMVELILDGQVSAGLLLQGVYVEGSGVTTPAGTTVRGVVVDLTTIAVASGTIEGQRITMPGTYGAATERAAIFTGDGRTVEVCSDTYAIDSTGDVRVTGKLTVTGSIDPTDILLSGSTALYLESNDGSTAPLSGAATGRLRYNNSVPAWQVSVQGGAYSSILTAATGAPIGSAYVTIGNDATLTAERALAVGTSLSLVDGGANSTVTLNAIQGIRTVDSPTFAGLTINGTANIVGALQISTVTLFEADRDLAVSLLPNADNSLNLGSTARRFASVFALNHDVRAAVSDANASALLSSNSLQLGVGGATALDVQLTRGAADRLDLATGDSFNIVSGNFQIGATTVFESDRDFAVSLVPNADNTLSIGSAARRVVTFDGVQFRRFGAVSDANPTFIVDTNGIRLGAGAGTAVDVQLSRGAANRLDLASGDSFNLVAGNITCAGTILATDNCAFGNVTALDARIGAQVLHGEPEVGTATYAAVLADYSRSLTQVATSTCFGGQFSITSFTQAGGVGSTELAGLYAYANIQSDAVTFTHPKIAAGKFNLGFISTTSGVMTVTAARHLDLTTFTTTGGALLAITTWTGIELPASVPASVTTAISFQSASAATFRHTGSVRIGSTVAPTQALDVTGSILGSTTCGFDSLGSIDATKRHNAQGSITTVTGENSEGYFFIKSTSAVAETGTLIGATGYSQWNTAGTAKNLTKAIGLLGIVENNMQGSLSNITTGIGVASRTINTTATMTTFAFFRDDGSDFTGGTPSTLVHFDATDLSAAAPGTYLSLRSLASTAEMRHVGAVKIGVNASPGAQLDVEQVTLGNAVLNVESTATNDDVKATTYQNRVATTDATVTTIHTVAIPASTTVMIETYVRARRTGGAAGTAEDAWCYVHVSLWKNVAGTATQVGATTAVVALESQAAFDVTHVASGGNCLIRVTGVASNNVTWHADVVVRPVGT